MIQIVLNVRRNKIKYLKKKTTATSKHETNKKETLQREKGSSSHPFGYFSKPKCINATENAYFNAELTYNFIINHVFCTL